MSGQSTSSPPSELAVSSTIRQGMETIFIRTSMGFLVGGLMGIVLARSGSSGARKAFAGLGAGVGLGSGWTRTSIDLEEMLASKK